MGREVVVERAPLWFSTYCRWGSCLRRGIIVVLKPAGWPHVGEMTIQDRYCAEHARELHRQLGEALKAAERKGEGDGGD